MENQMHYLEMALRNILGFIPTYMRPPYSECNDACQALLNKMGYDITYQSLVTFGKFQYISGADFRLTCLLKTGTITKTLRLSYRRTTLLLKCRK
jgi:peptidoglycan/xylan/chitin deacetylase (PgdA/CDA1 family)